MLIEEVEKSINSLQCWIEKNGWKGWDPYDTQCRTFLCKLAKRNKFFRFIHSLLFKYSNNLFPVFIRRVSFVRKKINPKAMGLFLSAYCTLYSISKNEQYLEKAKEIACWLLNNKNKKYKEYCWGYPFNWLSKIYIPKNTPSGVVTSNIGRGFWDLYKITNDIKYLDVCKSICIFFIDELNKIETKNGICFSYTPLDDFQVHNANLFVAEFLARVGNELSKKNWLDLALKATQFSLAEQNNDGSLCYWSRNQEEKYDVKCSRDHFHSGFELRMLYRIWKITNNKPLRKSLDRYYSFYSQNFFSEDYAPILEPQGDYYVDIHASAEALLTNSLLMDIYPQARELLKRTAKWSISNMQNKNGSYKYSLFKKNRRIKTVDIPYIRWGQAWMLLGLTKTLEKLTEEKS